MNIIVTLGIWLVAAAAGSSLPPAPETPAVGHQAPAAAIKVPTLWEYTAPLISPEKREQDPSIAQKDPSLVFFQGMLDKDKEGKGYGQFQWRIGMLIPAD